MAGRLTARADDHVGRAPGASLQGDDAAAAEFDIVGMGAEGHQRRRLRVVSAMGDQSTFQIEGVM